MYSGTELAELLIWVSRPSCDGLTTTPADETTTTTLTPAATTTTSVTTASNWITTASCVATKACSELSTKHPCTIIESPGFGNGNYEPGISIDYFIEPPQQCHGLNITFIEMFNVIGQEPDCDSYNDDFLQIKQIRGDFDKKFCIINNEGALPPSEYIDNAGPINVHFFTDENPDSVGEGFKILVCAYGCKTC